MNKKKYLGFWKKDFPTFLTLDKLGTVVLNSRESEIDIKKN